MTGNAYLCKQSFYGYLMNKNIFFIAFFVLLCFASCKPKKEKEEERESVVVAPPAIKRMEVQILGKIPHSGERKYTQGLEIKDGILYESTGLYNQSSLKKIDLKTGELLMSREVEGIFAEGLTIFNNYLTLLSYREGIAISYDLDELSDKGIGFNYEGEGWGLTNNGTMFIMSDGSDRLYFRNPYTFKVEKVLSVKIRGRPLYYINELEYVDGIVYANVFGLNMIFGIDENTGVVVKEIDASKLQCSMLRSANPEAVLNGIAYDSESNTFYLTGKECPYIYQVVFE